jgi:photosystem II stability/assembly factor-like uncharacterized protein
MIGLGWVALWTATVFAQDVPDGLDPVAEDAASEDSPTGEEPVVRIRAVPLFDTHAWYDAVPVDAATRVFMDLAARGPLALAVDGGGGVWRTEDGGSRWRQVMSPLAAISGPADFRPAPLSRDSGNSALEDRIRELADELSDNPDAFESDYDEDYEADSYGSGDIASAEDEQAEDATDAKDDGDSADTFLSELTQQVVLEGLMSEARSAGLREGSMRLGGVAWLHPDAPDLAMVGRADGLWRSTDGGRYWTAVDPLTTSTVFAKGPGELMMVGTADGLKYSVDSGKTWIHKSDPMDGQRVRDLAVGSDGTWWCATDQGLFASQDAENWEAVPLVGIRNQDVRALLAIPELSDGLLLTDNETFYRTDDGGQTVLIVGRQPLFDTTQLIAMGAPGHLMISGSDGVWESVDGGVRWRPVAAGLSDPQIFDLALIDGRLFAATLTGLLRLVEGRAETWSQEGLELAWSGLNQPVTVELRPLIFAATERQGLDPRIYSQRLFRRTGLLPTVVFAAGCGFGDRLDTNFNSPPTQQDIDRNCAVALSMAWYAPSSPGESEAVVVEDTVYLDSSLGGIPVAAASTIRKMTGYRYAIIDLLTELYLTREQLINRFETIPPDDLRAQVLHVLQIQEVTARLDGYTDGAFSRGNVGTENP